MDNLHKWTTQIFLLLPLMQTYGAISLTSVMEEIICAEDETSTNLLVMTEANMTFYAFYWTSRDGSGLVMQCVVFIKSPTNQLFKWINYQVWIMNDMSTETLSNRSKLSIDTNLCHSAPMKSITPPYFIHFSFGRSLCNQHVTRVFRTFATHPWFLHSPAPWLLAWPRRCWWLRQLIVWMFYWSYHEKYSNCSAS